MLYVKTNTASITTTILVFMPNQTLPVVAKEDYQPSGETDRTKVQHWQNTDVHSMFIQLLECCNEQLCKNITSNAGDLPTTNGCPGTTT